jgi:hypothetical protein
MRYNLRVNISQWTQCWADFDEVQPSGQHISINTMLSWFWWGTTFGSTYSNEHNAELILMMYSLLVKISEWKPWLTDFGEVQPSGQHISMKTMVDLFWWCTAFESTYLSEDHVWLILVRYKLRVNIFQWIQCSIDFGEVQPSGQHIPNEHNVWLMLVYGEVQPFGPSIP